jgi:hypothetical protein
VKNLLFKVLPEAVRNVEIGISARVFATGHDRITADLVGAFLTRYPGKVDVVLHSQLIHHHNKDQIIIDRCTEHMAAKGTIKLQCFTCMVVKLGVFDAVVISYLGRQEEQSVFFLLIPDPENDSFPYLQVTPAMGTNKEAIHRTRFY